MNDIVKVTVAEGKYTFRYEPGKTLACDRYSEPWIDEFNMGYNALVQLIHLADDQAQRIAKLEAALEVAAPYTIHMASDKAAARQAYAALGREVGSSKATEGE